MAGERGYCLSILSFSVFRLALFYCLVAHTRQYFVLINRTHLKGHSAMVKDTLEVRFTGPLQVTEPTIPSFLFSQPVAYLPGIYFSAVLLDQGGWSITYIGETSRNMCLRIKEHLVQLAGGTIRYVIRWNCGKAELSCSGTACGAKVLATNYLIFYVEFKTTPK